MFIVYFLPETFYVGNIISEAGGEEFLPDLKKILCVFINCSSMVGQLRSCLCNHVASVQSHFYAPHMSSSISIDQ